MSATSVQKLLMDSTLTLLSKFEQTVDPKEKQLHELLEANDIITLHKIFANQDGKRMNLEDLKEVLYEHTKAQYSDEEFETLFNKINIARDGLVTWDEFISYLILTFHQQEIKEGYESLEPPIPSSPLLIKSNHRHTVATIAFSPTVRPDRTVTWQDGSVMTCSKDGIINYWSLNMHLERTVQSSCPLLKVQQTWILDMVVLPDLSVVCTSSTERDLRFYDTSARKFELRVMFFSLDHAVSAMHYVFSQNINEESKLILGDIHGQIRVLFIQPIGRGPFKSTPGVPLLQERFERVSKNLVQGFRYVDFGRQHSDYVRQISYYPSLNSIVSCSQCPNVAMLMKDITETKDNYVYKIPKGVWCFALSDGVHLFASGGPDCLVRLWNPFVANKPVGILYGHHAGILRMILQDNGKKLYSLSKDKCVKVWDLGTQNCIQTYLQLPPELGEYSEMTTLYNPQSRQWIIGSSMIAIISLNPKQDGDHTDGNTHIGGISVILYNPLYKCLVTCGLDSYIIVWNPWDGRRMCVVKDAHTRSLHGESIPIEITAACFDPGYQRLLTAAHDGTLKVWNFNTGTCLRNMNIQQGCEVTSVAWVKGRMIAVGWNRRVTEFKDGQELIGPAGGAFTKNWDLRHKEDISCCAVRINQTLATATYNGELILWRLETGQAYKQFNVSDPTTRIKITYKPVKEKSRRLDVMSNVSKKVRKNLSRPGAQNLKKTESEDNVKSSRTSSKGVVDKTQQKVSFSGQPGPGAKRKSTVSGHPTAPTIAQKSSDVLVPEECVPLRQLAVHCMYFIQTRNPDPAIGSLLVSLENGSIQVWSHHSNGGFLTSFYAVHKSGDYVISMTTDLQDNYLFTGIPRLEYL